MCSTFNIYIEIGTKELLEERLNLRDMGGSTNKYNLVWKLKTISKNKGSTCTSPISSFFTFVSLRTCSTAYRLHRLTEKIDVELLKFGTGECL
jgi:hypothetical protein